MSNNLRVHQSLLFGRFFDDPIVVVLIGMGYVCSNNFWHICRVNCLDTIHQQLKIISTRLNHEKVFLITTHFPVPLVNGSDTGYNVDTSGQF